MKWMWKVNPNENKVRELDTLAEAIIKGAPLGIYIVQDRRFRLISPQFTEITGYDLSDLEGVAPLSIVHEEDRDLVRQAALAMLKGKRKSPYQFRVITKEGAVKWIMETVASITYEGGQATLGNFMDISQQIALSEAFREQEELLSAILSSSPLGIALVEDMVVKWANRAMSRILGFNDETELVDKGVQDFCASPEEFERIRKAVFNSPGQGGQSVLDARFVRSNGSCFDGELRVARVTGLSNTERFVSTLTDISWRKKAEADLMAEKQWLSVTLRSIGDGVICTDKEGRIVLMNKVAEELTGWTEKEAIGKDFGEVFRIIDEFTRQKATDPIRNVLETGRVRRLPDATLLISKDGSEILIGDSAAPVKSQEGEVLGVVVVFRDITMKRTLEQELAKMQKLEAIGRLAGGIAHDFNNMLMGILGYITLARMDSEGQEDVAKSLKKAEQACLRAKDLSLKLITFSEGGEPQRELIEAAKFLKDSVKFALSGRNVGCNYSFSENLWQMDIDVRQMTQVINSIVTNAVEATLSNGMIEVRADNMEVGDDVDIPLRPGRYVKVAIRDDGKGIPESDLNKVFDPFYSTKEAGRGLGLSIAHSIVKKHGGHITVNSRPGSGTTVTIYLPAKSSYRERVDRAEEVPQSSCSRVLLMDDEEMVRDVAKKMLEQLGYEVEVAQNGEEAIALYTECNKKDEGFNAAILDLTVPGGMGGEEAANKLKQLNPSLPVIASSGYSDDPVMIGVKDGPFDARIVKPYTIEQLSALLKQMFAACSRD